MRLSQACGALLSVAHGELTGRRCHRQLWAGRRLLPRVHTALAQHPIEWCSAGAAAGADVGPPS